MEKQMPNRPSRLTFDLHSELSDSEDAAAPRERLLFWLLKHPYQRIEDMALALHLPASSVYRYLQDLLQQGQIEQLRASFGLASTRSLFYLTTLGIQTVATMVNMLPANLARMWRADETHVLTQLPRVPTLLHLQEVINSLVVHAPQALAYPNGQAASIRWHWLAAYRHAFLAKGKATCCRVDAALVLARHPAGDDAPQHREYAVLFVLIDPGFVGNHDLAFLRDRLERLLRFRESAERWPQYQSFPTILVIVPTPRHLEQWQWCAREAATRLRGAGLRGAIVARSPGMVVGSAWSFAWQNLSQPGPCRLQELLTMMPRESVPAGLLAPKAVPAGTMRNTPMSRKGIVLGRFAQRALAPIPSPSSRAHVEREAAAMLGIQINRRLLEIVLVLYAHPLLSADELAVLLQMERTTLMRYLYDLRQCWCVEKRATRCGTRLLVSSRGLRLIAMVLDVSILHLCEKREDATQPLIQRGVPHLLKRIKHTAGIYRWMMQLHQAAQQAQQELVWWETGARCAQRYHTQGVWHNLLPDAAFAYRAGEQQFRIWLEWDEGTMNGRDLAAKLHSYGEFVRTRLWLQESPQVPMLIFVVPDYHQERRVRRLAERILAQTSLVVRTTTAPLVAEYGPLEAIWLPVLPQSPSMVNDLPARKRWLDG